MADLAYSWVRTAMGNAGAQMFGMKEAALTIEESVAGLIQVVRYTLPRVKDFSNIVI